MRRHKFNSRRKFEKLEDRRMMAGDVSFNEANGILTINGTDDDDVVDVRFEGARVNVDVNDSDIDFENEDLEDDGVTIANVTKIVFNGFAGDDELTVDVRNLNSGVTLDNVYLDFRGGADDDTLNSDLDGGVRVVARGEEGNDTLQGSRFRDVLEGGAGDDDLAGGDDNDAYSFDGTLLGRDIVREDPAESDNVSPDFLFSDYAVNNDALVFMDAEFAVNVDISSTAEQVVNSEHLRLRLTSATGIEDVFGSRVAANTIIGNSLSNWLRGGDQNDHITGAGGNDLLDGHKGDDTYYFTGTNLGADGIDEWDGDLDTLDFRGMAQGLNIDLTKARTDSSAMPYAVNSTGLKLVLVNSDTIERVYGTERDDTIIGNSRDNHLLGMGGPDKLTGGIGNDTLEGGAGNDTYFFAGSSNLGIDLIVEAEKADTDTLDFSGMPKGVVVDLLTVAGTDYGAVSDNVIVRLSNVAAIEDVVGSHHDDVIFGNSRNNRLVGERGGDILQGRLGDDTLEGGIGDDIYGFAGSNLGTDAIIEAANTGTDTLDFTGMSSGVTVDISRFGAAYAVDSANFKLKLSNDTAIENVYGSDYNDRITGNNRENKLYGGRGRDEIRGGFGADRLDGGADNDILWSDVFDEVYGGTGYDTFDGYEEATFPFNPRPGVYKDWRRF